MDDLNTRIIRLEREARMWRVAALIVVAVAIVAPATSQTERASKEGSVVKAPFRVTNSQGKTILEVAEAEQDTVTLTLRNPPNKSAVSLGAGSDLGGTIISYREDGQLGGMLHSGGMLATGGKKAYPVVGLSASVNGGAIRLATEDGKNLVGIGGEDHGGGGMTLYDPKNVPAIDLEFDDVFGGILRLRNRENESRLYDGSKEP